MLFRLGRWLEVSTGARDFVPGPSAVSDWDTFLTMFDEEPTEAALLTASVNVYACVSLRASTIAGLPLRLYRGAGDDRVEIESGPARDLFDRVNPFWTFKRLVAMTEMSLSLWGEAYWFVESGKGTLPAELWWARPDRVRVIPHATKYIAGYALEDKDTGQLIPFAPEEVIRFAYPNPLDEFSGLSPLTAASLSATLGTRALKSNDALFTAGMNPGGFIFPSESGAGLSTSITDEQAQALRNKLARDMTGEGNRHRWEVFKHRFDIEPFTMSPKDAEFMGALAWSLEDVARAYQIPLDLVGGQRTYENVAAAERALWARFGQPETSFIATEITEQLLPRFGTDLVAEFDLSEVTALQDDENAQWAREQGQLAAGVITVEEWRADHGLPPLPEAEPAPAEAPPLELIPPLEDGEAQRALCDVLGRMQDSVTDKLAEGAAKPFDSARWQVATVRAVEPALGGGARAIKEAQAIAATFVATIARDLDAALVEESDPVAAAVAVFARHRETLELEALSRAIS